MIHVAGMKPCMVMVAKVNLRLVDRSRCKKWFYNCSLNDLSVEKNYIEFLAGSAVINLKNSLPDYIKEENWPYKSSNLNPPCLDNMGVTKKWVYHHHIWYQKAHSEGLFGIPIILLYILKIQNLFFLLIIFRLLTNLCFLSKFFQILRKCHK